MTPLRTEAVKNVSSKPAIKLKQKLLVSGLFETLKYSSSL
jgi:hypothetical protein